MATPNKPDNKPKLPPTPEPTNLTKAKTNPPPAQQAVKLPLQNDGLTQVPPQGVVVAPGATAPEGGDEDGKLDDGTMADGAALAAAGIDPEDDPRIVVVTQAVDPTAQRLATITLTGKGGDVVVNADPRSADHQNYVNQGYKPKTK